MKKIIWGCVAAVVLLAVVFGVIYIAGNGSRNAADPMESNMPVISDRDRETYEIPFGDLTLKYPKEWQNKVKTEEQPDGSLVFSAGKTMLFTLYPDGSHSPFGTVMGETNIAIGVEMGQISEKDAEKALMQEDINVIILHLSEDYDFQPGVAVPAAEYDLIPIETSVTTLYYPAKWKDQVKIDVAEDQVSFSADGTPLFDVVFTECGGHLLGMYGDTPIFVVEHEVTDETHALMQMGINDILEHLMEDDQFVANG